MADKIINQSFVTTDSSDRIRRPTSSGVKTLTASGLLLGFSLGGLIIEIVVHLLLQWSYILSNIFPMDTLPGLRVNIFSDGVFDLTMWLIAVTGLGLLWWSIKQGAHLAMTTRAFIGWNIVGWGGLTLFDSIVFHTLLRLHQLRQVSNFLVYEIAYFVIGLLLVLAGLLIARSKSTEISAR